MTAPSARYDLAGRTALVTGAGGLLGRQHTAALADVGARVVVTDIGLTQCEAAIAAVRQVAPSADLVPLAIDVTSQQSVADAAAELERRGIQVDILVNNAAIDPKVTSTPGVMHSSRFEAFPVPQWQMEIAVGLTGAMLCSQVFGTAMAKRGHGVLVNAISPGGVFNNQDPAFVERLTRLIPMGRMAKVDEYCAAVQFLCSDASSYMTGQNLVMDGGRSVW